MRQTGCFPRPPTSICPPEILHAGSRPLYISSFRKIGRGLRVVGIENRRLPLTWFMAYTTACTTAQAIIPLMRQQVSEWVEFNAPPDTTYGITEAAKGICVQPFGSVDNIVVCVSVCCISKAGERDVLITLWRRNEFENQGTDAPRGKTFFLLVVFLRFLALIAQLVVLVSVLWWSEQFGHFRVRCSPNHGALPCPIESSPLPTDSSSHCNRDEFTWKSCCSRWAWKAGGTLRSLSSRTWKTRRSGWSWRSCVTQSNKPHASG